MAATQCSTFAGKTVAAKGRTVRRAQRAVAARAAQDVELYPEWGNTPYDDPSFEWAAENSPWGGWDNMDQDIKERWAQFELIQGRWAMLGTAGAWSAEQGTGIPWFQAGKVCTPSDCSAVNTIFPGQVIPLSPTEGFPTFNNVAALTFVLMFLAESYRTGIIDPVFDEFEIGDLHPGGRFDPLGLSESQDLNRMKVAELKHARLAMFAWFGYYSQALTTNEGAYTGSLPSFTEGAAGPYANWQAHVADPMGANVWTELGLF